MESWWLATTPTKLTYLSSHASSSSSLSLFKSRFSIEGMPDCTSRSYCSGTKPIELLGPMKWCGQICKSGGLTQSKSYLYKSKIKQHAKMWQNKPLQGHANSFDIPQGKWAQEISSTSEALWLISAPSRHLQFCQCCGQGPPGQCQR